MTSKKTLVRYERAEWDCHVVRIELCGGNFAECHVDVMAGHLGGRARPELARNYGLLCKRLKREEGLSGRV